MTQSNNSLKNIAVTYGIILAAVSITILVLMYVLNLKQEWYISVISLGLTIFIIASGIVAYKKSQGGYISLVQSLKAGMAIAAIAGIIGAVYTYVHYSFVYPEFIEMTLEESRSQILKMRPDISDTEMEQSLELSRTMSTPFIFATISLIGTIFIGFLISLFTGLIVKKEDPYAQQ